MYNNPHPDSIPPATPEDFLPPIKIWTQIGGYLMIITLGASIMLSALLKYRVTVKAPAIIRPIGELRLVEATSQGKVISIEVEDNQEVKEGDIIVYIEDSALQNQKSQLQSNLIQDQQQLKQLNEQITALNDEIKAESNQNKRSLTEAQAQLSLAQRNYEDAQIITIAQLDEAKAMVELANEEVTRYTQLAEAGAISLLQLKEKEASLKTAQARLKQVQTALNPSMAEVTMAQERIAQIKAQGESTLARLRQKQQEVLQKVTQLQNQLNVSQQELEQINTNIEDTVIRSPVRGIITQLNLRNINQVVKSGDIIAQIAPLEAPLEIKAFVSSEDISKVKISQQVQMRVNSCPYPDYGTLSATVGKISPDVVTNQSFNSSMADLTGQNIYEVTIIPNDVTLISEGKQCSLQTGMDGRADIITQEDTILKFFLRKARILTNL